MTAVGPIAVTRTYFHCATCRQGEFGGDRVLGIDGFVTPGARRIVAVLGIQKSFAKAEFTLAETVGWKLDDDTIRKLCHETARHATQTREERVTSESFAEAKAASERPVDTELQIDAGKINTADGWRDVKVAVFACRERGEPIAPAEWDERDLPAPAVRSVIAAVEEARLFGDRCEAEAKRLEQTNPEEISIQGDGAEWIWNLAEQRFPGAKQTLDFWHGADYVDAGAKAVLGDIEAAAAAFERGKGKLLEDGYWGVTEWIGELLGQKVAGGDGASLGGVGESLGTKAAGDVASLGSVLNYLCGHQDRLHYAARLRRGQSIGSGMVEGTIKQLLNIRMKQTGARWKVDHVGPFVEFGALVDETQWGKFWETYR
jgi:hypothetical protein